MARSDKKGVMLTRRLAREVRAMAKRTRAGKGRVAWRERRRVPAGGGGGSARIEGATAFIKGTVPKTDESTMDTSGDLTAGATLENPLGKQVVAFGKLTAVHSGTNWTVGALLVDPESGKAICRDDPDNPGTLILYVVDVLNPALTDFVGEGPGVTVNGSLGRSEVGDGQGGTTTKEFFLLPTVEIRTRPNYDPAKDMWAISFASDGDRSERCIEGWSQAGANGQSVQHKQNEDTKFLDDGPCP